MRRTPPGRLFDDSRAIGAARAPIARQVGPIDLRRGVKRSGVPADDEAVALRHWFVVLFVVPAIAGGALVAILTGYSERVLGVGPRSGAVTIENLLAGAATAGLVALASAHAMRGGAVRGVFAASAGFALTFFAFFGWMFGILMVWAYVLCEPGTHDMCLRR